LMIEHRLIEKAVPLMKVEICRLEKEKRLDPGFISEMVDFFRTYADRCHHGKEEDILFRALEKKTISPEHKKTMDELLAEHVVARASVGKFAGSKTPEEAVEQMKKLSDLYPKHIEKEDKHFFIPVMKYFSQPEQDEMLAKMYEFDRKLVHEKYAKVLQSLKR
jgi:hemerythrin-like domain-containing protein